MYGNISCGRRSTKLPGASVVTKSENFERTVHSGRIYFGSMRRMIVILERLHFEMLGPSLRSVRLWDGVSTGPKCWQSFVVLSCTWTAPKVMRMIFLRKAERPRKEIGGRGRWKGNPGIQFDLPQLSPRLCSSRYGSKVRSCFCVLSRTKMQKSLEQLYAI